jgi:CheY-like chemotaxis protein
MTAEQPSPTSSYVLVVEDDGASRALMRRIASHADPPIDVIAVTHGHAALMLAQAVPPAAVVLDLGLPGMTGREFLAALRENPDTSTIPVIVVTADALPSTEAELMLAGVSAFLVKPVDVRKTRAVLRDLLAVTAAP